jgi:indole-3-glycerol phosphate synthase
LNILNEITIRTKERINEKKKTVPFENIKEAAEQISANQDFSCASKLHPGTEPYGGCAHSAPLFFEKALRGDDISFICEIKRASPSKGIITEDFPYLQIAEDYQSAGVAAISVLTEPFYFGGDDHYLREIADTVSVPLLRKDFTVDEYMIYEAKVLGASAVLLICSILDSGTLAEYIKTAHRLGLSALVETHDETEIKMALDAGARIIGVNNRDLKTFAVDIKLSERLRALVPGDIIFVSESGIQTPGDIMRLRKIKANAALIGETLMRSPDKMDELKRLRGECPD